MPIDLTYLEAKKTRKYRHELGKYFLSSITWFLEFLKVIEKGP